MSSRRTMLGLIAALVAFSPFESEIKGYSILPKSDVPFHTLRRVDARSLADIAAACNADAECRAFNTLGELKRRADCGWGSDYCVYPQGQPYPPADGIDLFIKQGVAPPADWLPRIKDGTLLYASPEPNICEMPEVGNGYIASIVGFASTHLAGLYFGGCGSTHKARLPSPIAGITARGAALVQAALDTTQGMYRRRYRFADGTVVEQRILAHRTRPHVLLTEFELIEGKALALNLSTLYDFDQQPQPQDGLRTAAAPCPNPGGKRVERPDGTSYPYFGMPCRTGQDSDCGECWTDNRCLKCCQPHAGPSTAGNGCAGSFVTTDVVWSANASGLAARGSLLLIHQGTIAQPNDDGNSPTVAIVVDAVPASVTLSRGTRASVRFVAVVVASVGMPSGFNVTAAAFDEHLAVESVETAALMREHVGAWAELMTSRIEVGGTSTSERAWQIQTHFSSSYYYLLSTIRADWSLGGFSPGGLASQNYEGAVFMDQEFCAPAYLDPTPSGLFSLALPTAAVPLATSLEPMTSGLFSLALPTAAVPLATCLEPMTSGLQPRTAHSCSSSGYRHHPEPSPD